jgi:hypothetical protein
MNIKEKITYRTKSIIISLRFSVIAAWFQIAGLALIAAAYFLFGFGHPYLGWFVALLPVGMLELFLMWVWNTTITKFGRHLLPKMVDRIIMLGLIAITWWWFGPNAAGLYFIGLLSNHFGEAQ